MQYGTWWRRHRKTFHQYFYPQAAANYRPAQTSEGRKTLKKLLDRPEEFADHVRQYVNILRSHGGKKLSV